MPAGGERFAGVGDALRQQPPGAGPVFLGGTRRHRGFRGAARRHRHHAEGPLPDHAGGLASPVSFELASPPPRGVPAPPDRGERGGARGALVEGRLDQQDGPPGGHRVQVRSRGPPGPFHARGVVSPPDDPFAFGHLTGAALEPGHGVLRRANAPAVDPPSQKRKVDHVLV